MTTQEFSNEFDIYYNSIATNDAPNLDLYEKSVYLTRAQLEIIHNYFNPKGNKYKEGFEQSTKRRADLRELIRPGFSTTNSIELDSNDGLSEDSQFFRIKKNVYMIIQEKAKIESDDPCLDGKYLKVVPKTYDEFNTQINNPFKKPDEETIWRYDLYSTEENILSTDEILRNVELISPYKITEYKFRYIVFPSPIILTDLNDAFPMESLSIYGETDEQTCKLGEGVHNEILNRAVEIAVADYKPSDLQSKLIINNRNE